MIESRIIRRQNAEVCIWDGSEAEIAEFIGRQFAGMNSDGTAVFRTFTQPVVAITVLPGNVFIKLEGLDSVLSFRPGESWVEVLME